MTPLTSLLRLWFVGLFERFRLRERGDSAVKREDGGVGVERRRRDAIEGAADDPRHGVVKGEVGDGDAAEARACSRNCSDEAGRALFQARVDCSEKAWEVVLRDRRSSLQLGLRVKADCRADLLRPENLRAEA